MKKTTVFGNLKLTGTKAKIEKLENIMNVDVNLKTVKSYIEENPGSVISKRVSKKGTKMVTVKLPEETKELQESRILSGAEIYI